MLSLSSAPLQPFRRVPVSPCASHPALYEDTATSHGTMTHNKRTPRGAHARSPCEVLRLNNTLALHLA